MIYSLSNHLYHIQVSTLGAELRSLEKEGVNYLWTKSPPFWQRHAPVLFPIVGKLKGNSYQYHGKEYTLPQHGFARDSKFECVEEKGDTLLFRLVETREINYPFQFDFYIRYSLSGNGVKTTYTVENKGVETLPFSIGAHPGFLCPFFDEEKLEDYYFEFEADLTLNRILLTDGLLTLENQSVLLENKRLYLSELLFEDDALVISNFKSKSVALKSDRFSLKVTWDNCTFLGLWKQRQAPFVCIEPWWGVADSINHNQDILSKRGINLLAPEEKKDFWFEIAIG